MSMSGTKKAVDEMLMAGFQFEVIKENESGSNLGSSTDSSHLEDGSDGGNVAAESNSGMDTQSGHVCNKCIELGGKLTESRAEVACLRSEVATLKSALSLSMKQQYSEGVDAVAEIPKAPPVKQDRNPEKNSDEQSVFFGGRTAGFLNNFLAVQQDLATNGWEQLLLREPGLRDDEEKDEDLVGHGRIAMRRSCLQKIMETPNLTFYRVALLLVKKVFRPEVLRYFYCRGSNVCEEKPALSIQLPAVCCRDFECFASEMAYKYFPGVVSKPPQTMKGKHIIMEQLRTEARKALSNTMCKLREKSLAQVPSTKGPMEPSEYLSHGQDKECDEEEMDQDEEVSVD